MSYNQAIADKILGFAALEPSIPVGHAHDLRLDDVNQDDFQDTAKHLISSGQITATIQEDYAGLFIAFRQ